MGNYTEIAFKTKLYKNKLPVWFPQTVEKRDALANLWEESQPKLKKEVKVPLHDFFKTHRGDWILSTLQFSEETNNKITVKFRT